MKKIVLVCGVIAGLVTISWGIFATNFLEKGTSYNMRMVFGYAAMVLGFSLIFVGIKRFRDNENGGVITFGKALKVALLITLVAGTVYVLFWEIDYYCFLPNFNKDMIEATHAQLIVEGKTAAEIQAKMTEMKSFMESYKKPIVNIAMTYTEIIPPGVIISLIAAAILKRKEPKVA